ncbi:hypothetical protein [Planktotalea sp.]|nr:hypothetical protein [Planktotalea sp.]
MMFKSFGSANVTLADTEVAQAIREAQFDLSWLSSFEQIKG